jgi:transposase
MISFTRRTKVYVSREPVDMRASYDTLFSKAKGVLNQDPLSGHLFVFINTKRTSIKCLYYDGTGLVLLCKRLEKSTFSRLNPMYRGEITLTAAEFALFFEGADFEKRFIESPPEIKKENFQNTKNKIFPTSQSLQEINL